MAAYKGMAVEIADVLALLDKGEYTKVKTKLVKIHEALLNKNKDNTKKVLLARQNSQRAHKLHCINNRIDYAKKKNNIEAVKKLEAEKEYIKKNIFD